MAMSKDWQDALGRLDEANRALSREVSGLSRAIDDFLGETDREPDPESLTLDELADRWLKSGRGRE